MDKSLTPEEIKTLLKQLKTIINMYAFYDTESQTYDTPFFCKSDLFAQRHYEMATSQKDSMLAKFKDNFEVHQICTFCMQTGETTPLFNVLIKKGKK